MSAPSPVSEKADALAKATAQEIQLELIRRRKVEAFDGERVVATLMAHRDLWEAVMMDRLAISNPGRLPAMGLIKLRDLPYDEWNVDTLYILAPNAESARKLAAISEWQDSGGMVQVHDDERDVQSALGGTVNRQHAVASIWWD